MPKKIKEQEPEDLSNWNPYEELSNRIRVLEDIVGYHRVRKMNESHKINKTFSNPALGLSESSSDIYNISHKLWNEAKLPLEFEKKA